MAPNHKKIRYRGAALPEFLSPILQFYNPIRYKRKVKRLYSEPLIKPFVPMHPLSSLKTSKMLDN